jgi:ABC-type amino acid transport substrate-binding protein
MPKSFRVGIQRGVIQSENDVAGRKGVVRADTVSELAHKLSGGSIDVVLSFGRIFEEEYSKLDLQGILTKGAPLSEVVVYHYLHRNHEHLVDDIDQIVKTMTADGSIFKITKSLFIN